VMHALARLPRRLTRAASSIGRGEIWRTCISSVRKAPVRYQACSDDRRLGFRA
jgi:hypothetical protein